VAPADGARRLTIAAAALALAACEVPAPTAPPPPPGLVVFSVLNPSGPEQVVLLMQSRGAVPDAAGFQFVPEDPIVTSGETPVTNARVVLVGPAGDSAVLVEDRVRRADRLGAGVYRLWSGSAAGAIGAGATEAAHLPVTAGGAYALRVTAVVAGDVITATGTARVPTVARPVVTATVRSVSRARDSVVLADPGVAGASGFVYSLRTANGAGPIGEPQYRGAFEPRLLLPGAAAPDAAFGWATLVPGTRVVLTVTAADSNYYAYYRADADPFADRSRRTTLVGASGLFGAALPVASVPVAVTN
jgi:hypothetical protein